MAVSWMSGTTSSAIRIQIIKMNGNDIFHPHCPEAWWSFSDALVMESLENKGAEKSSENHPPSLTEWAVEGGGHF